MTTGVYLRWTIQGVGVSKPYSIRIFVPTGNPDGLRTIEKSNWSGAAGHPRGQLIGMCIRRAGSCARPRFGDGVGDGGLEPALRGHGVMMRASVFEPMKARLA
jgi:hypothetical protein